MSSDPPSGARSSEPEPSLAARVKARGSELLDALERHLPGSRDHADGTAAYAFAAAVELDLERDHAEAVRETARLHEVGNVYVPVAVLTKPPGELTAGGRGRCSTRDSPGAPSWRVARASPMQACEWIGAVGSASTEAGRRAWPASGSRSSRGSCALPAPATRPWPRRRLAAPRRTSGGGCAIQALRAAAGSELDPRVTAALAAMLERAAAAP